MRTIRDHHLTSTDGHPHRPVRGRAPLERAIHALERAEWLDGLGKRAGTLFARVVRPGPAKDALSGSWLGHPAHPMLTDVAIGAWTGAMLLDVAGGDARTRAADSLVGAGVVAAVPTALTGLNDLTDVVSKEDRALGAAHALGNAAAVVLYGASWIARRAGARGMGLGLSALGAGAVTIAGFLGGHLAYRRGIGVAQNIFEPRAGEWLPVVDASELHDGKPRRVYAGGVEVMLVRTEGRILALANRCSHRGGPLHKGAVDGDTIECPWHKSMFRISDGEVVRGPATAPQPAYDARVRDGRVEVRAR